MDNGIYNKEVVCREFGYGWNDLYEKLCGELEPYNAKIMQAKEKYGNLTVYLDEYDKKAYEIVQKYYVLSQYICEQCGNKGIARQDLYYIRTLCDDCYNLEKKKYDI